MVSFLCFGIFRYTCFFLQKVIWLEMGTSGIVGFNGFTPFNKRSPKRMVWAPSVAHMTCGMEEKDPLSPPDGDDAYSLYYPRGPYLVNGGGGQPSPEAMWRRMEMMSRTRDLLMDRF
jgi:hypothetical protein